MGASNSNRGANSSDEERDGFFSFTFSATRPFQTLVCLLNADIAAFCDNFRMMFFSGIVSVCPTFKALTLFSLNACGFASKIPIIICAIETSSSAPILLAIPHKVSLSLVITEFIAVLVFSAFISSTIISSCSDSNTISSCSGSNTISSCSDSSTISSLSASTIISTFSGSAMISFCSISCSTISFSSSTTVSTC